MAKRNLILLLSSALLVPALLSCGPGEPESQQSSSPSQSPESFPASSEEIDSLSGFAQTLKSALESGKEKTSGFSLTLEKDAYYKGKITKKEKALFSGASYSDDVLSLSASGEVYYANKDGGFDLEQGNQNFYHEYGYLHGLFIDAFYNVDGTEKSLSVLRSKGVEMEEKDAQALLASSRLDFAGVDNQATILHKGNVYLGGSDFLYQTYFGESGYFTQSDAEANATFQKQGDSLTLSTYFDEKDANDDVYRRNFLFEFAFQGGLLVEASGSEEDHLVSGSSVSESISSGSSFKLSNQYEAKTSSNTDFNRFFYTDYIPFLGENPYSVTEVDSAALNTKYFVQIGEARPNTAVRNIDSILLQSAMRNGEEAKESDFSYEEEDKAITFLRGGDYELTFLSRAGVKRTLSVSLEEVSA